ncbi:hypothetical protein ACRALDRAFT_1066098 [Sodiomyces alcalophilus JCM 7366]|uniref:uncharacterized protein n=1 Tax=Sodiomyces alcalophilus JCM 7366 TaxID=591952 RepID=UPI0039B535AB
MTVWDRHCTAENQSTFSTAFYRSWEAYQQDEVPIDGFPCWRPDALLLPVRLQSPEDWLKNGCREGFLCANNTVNSLPQYCPPLTECQQARLVGEACIFEGRNIGMGPFEPIICQPGWYCPKSSNGNVTLPCPAGSYCQPGAATPTPCAFGSVCPEGSQNELFLIPIALLGLIDLTVLIAFLIYFFHKRSKKKSREKASSSDRALHVPFLGGKSKGASDVKATITGYRQIDDENQEGDHEMMPLEATYAPGRDGWTGFQAALDDDVPALRRADTLNPQLRTFIESMQKATNAIDLGLSFAYDNLSFHPKSTPRPILQNVTGSIHRGSLVAVMGGSGAGKSTFVNVLMGKTTNTGGTVTVNDIPGKIKRYKKIIGYVPQDDIVLPELTVYENIVHSAKVRLPSSWRDAEIEAHVDSVIDCLELSHVRDSLVGSVGKPVISGGQRKRVSIGMELAAAPMAIFLDEPTSGLDATAASSIMRTLKALARLGISVIVIIHQPRMEIFEILDNLILLGNGQTIYEGPEADVQRYFEGIGFQFPPHVNPADVVTDIITGNGRAYKKVGDVSKDALISHWAATRKARTTLGVPEDQVGGDDDNDDDDSDRRSPLSVTSDARSNRKSLRIILRRRGATHAKQIWLCLRRAMLQQYRLKAAFFFEMALASLAGFLLGLAQQPQGGVLFTGFYLPPYQDLSLSVNLGGASQLPLLKAIAIGLVCGAPGVKVFSEEMLLQRREAEAGHSRLAYFLAKTVSVLPRMLLGCLHFTTLVFILARPVIPWGIGFATNLLYFYSIYGLASCVSMVVRREDAPLMSTMTSLVVGLLSGAAPSLASVKRWRLEWLWRASPGVWFAETYFSQLVEPFAYLYNVEWAAAVMGYSLGNLTLNLLVLLAIGTAYRFIAFALLFVGKRMRV